jgi:hypothetical protein
MRGTLNHVALSALLLVAQSCRRIEQPHRFYRTHAEAVGAGEVLRGWLPTWVPPEATDIHVQGDLDTNQRWLRFRLPSAPATAIKSRLMAVSMEQVADIPFSRPSHSDWWFDGLVQQQPANDGALNADVFRANDHERHFLVAFDRTSDTVFAW